MIIRKAIILVILHNMQSNNGKGPCMSICCHRYIFTLIKHCLFSDFPREISLQVALCILSTLYCHAAPTVPTDHNTHTPTLNTDCQEPDDLNHMMDELRAKWPQLDKFYRFSREEFKSGDISSYLHIGSGQLYGDTSCPSKLPDTSDAELRDRSTCPWYYVINEDRTRHPQLLAEARCKCRGVWRMRAEQTGAVRG